MMEEDLCVSETNGTGCHLLSPPSDPITLTPAPLHPQGLIPWVIPSDTQTCSNILLFKNPLFGHSGWGDLGTSVSWGSDS